MDSSLYPPINPHKNEIRTLRLSPGAFTDAIEIELRTANLQDDPPPGYYALSYAWGESPCPDPAMVNSYPMTITANLDAALRHLRHETRHRVLWIDAICINQGDTAERSQQVQLMSKIYSGADRVLVWLGPSADGSDALLDCIVRRSVPREDSRAIMTSLVRLCERSWFERVWVVQEFALSAREPTFICGNKAVSWTDLYSFLRMIHSGIDTDIPYDGERFDPAFSNELADVRTESAIIDHSNQLHNLHVTRAEIGRMAFSGQFHRTMHLKATDPRDKVFGILGICAAISGEAPVMILPDYSTTTEHVFSQAMALIIQEHFAYGYPHLPLHTPAGEGQTSLNLPSWVPDMRAVKVGGFRTDRDHPYILCPDEDFIQDLVRCGRGQAPMAHFSADYTTLFAGGNILGVVEESLELPAYGKSVYAYIQDIRRMLGSRMVSSESVLMTLVGARNMLRAQWDNGQLRALFKRLENLATNLETQNTTEASDSLPFHPSFVAMLRYSCPSRTVFVTDTGKFGMAPGPIRSGDILAGLFNINFPFILRPGDGDGPASASYFTMVNVAHIGGHQWGSNGASDERNGNAGDDMYRRLGLRQFEIR